MPGVKGFARELKRRKVYRVAIVYAVVAFVIWGAAEQLVPGLALPDWAFRLIVLLTILNEVVVGEDELHAASRYLPSVYERLGALYEARGEPAKAIHYYGKLVELWKDADPQLQPRVEAARRAIEALSPDT